MTQLASIGHNNPPDPIDTALEPFGDVITEAETWLDGTRVETEGQMKAADTLIKGVKAARKAVDEARDTVTKPLHEAWKAEVARWKPTQDDLDRIVKGLVALVDDFKRKLAAEKEASRKKAEAEAWEATRKAQEAARQADAANLEAQREAAAAMAEAEEKQRQAQAAAKDVVKGLRTVHRHTIDDHRAALHWIAKHDRDAVTAFVEAYVAKNFKTAAIDGVTVTTEREAF
jgi:chromosome segregation ATPase